METEVLESVETVETICDHPRLQYKRSVVRTGTSDTGALKLSGFHCPDCELDFVATTDKGAAAEGVTIPLVTLDRLAQKATKPAGRAVQPEKPKAPEKPKEGPGTEMLQLTNELGIVSPPACGCKSMAATMDRLGVHGCRERITDLRLSVAAGWDAWGWRDKLKAVTAATWKSAGLGVSPTDPVRDLLEIAIERAEQKTKGTT